MARAGNRIITKGYVNFPIHSSRWVDSGEGGLIVQLWAIPKLRKNRPKWATCSGVNHVTAFFGETLIGTARKENDDVCPKEGLRKGMQIFPLEERLFDGKRWPPRFSMPMRRTSLISIPLLACVTIGNTNWTGRKGDEGGDCWRCKEEDLTAEGMELLDQMTKLYLLDAKIEIVTWLDT